MAAPASVQADHLGRQPDHRPALRLRRRPRLFISPGYDCSGTVSFALHGASPAAARRWTPREFMSWGARRHRPVGHDLLQPRARLHGRRRAAPGHERRRRPVRPAGSALAPAAPRQSRLHDPPPRRAVTVGRRYAEARAPGAPGRGGRLRLSLPQIAPAATQSPIGGSDGRLDRAHVHGREGEGLEAARPRRGPRRDARLQLPKQLEQLQNVKKGIADVVTAKKRLQMQESDAAAAGRQARHPGAPGAGRRPGGSRARRAGAQERRPDRAAVARPAGQPSSRTSSRS